MTIEIVDFPLNLMIFHSYVKLPEGTYLDVEQPTWFPVICVPQTILIGVINLTKLS